MVILVAIYAYATISTYGFLNPQLPPSGFYWGPQCPWTLTSASLATITGSNKA